MISSTLWIKVSSRSKIANFVFLVFGSAIFIFSNNSSIGGILTVEIYFKASIESFTWISLSFYKFIPSHIDVKDSFGISSGTSGNGSFIVLISESDTVGQYLALDYSKKSWSYYVNCSLSLSIADSLISKSETQELLDFDREGAGQIINESSSFIIVYGFLI